MKILNKDEIIFIRNDKKYFDPDFLSVRKLMLEKKIIPVICGPTCTGKSALAFNLAKIFETDIISIDSMQVYRGLDIGTDKYDSSQIGIKQYMTDIFEPDHKLTVLEFRDICRNIIEEEFFKKGRVPILAGGSGLYLRAVIDELDFTADNENDTGGGNGINISNDGSDNDNLIGNSSNGRDISSEIGNGSDISHYNGCGNNNGSAGCISSSNKSGAGGGTAGEDEKRIREELYNEAESSADGLYKLYMKLKELDPLYCAKISPNDKKRIIRAMEVHTLTGRTFSSFQNKWQTRKSIYNCSIAGLLIEKERLHANIEKRVDIMLEKGLIPEVQALAAQGYKDSNSLKQAVGYKEVLRYLSGDIDIDICRQDIIKNTRRLAKKQMTWFKADSRINWIRTDNYGNIFDLIEHVLNIFRSTSF